MKLLIQSDIHTEYQLDSGLKFCAKLPSNIDVLILAGDVGVKKSLFVFLKAVCAKFKHVIYVPGNHDYWYESPSTFSTKIRNLNLNNLYFLNNEFITIENQRFYGGTLWFPDDPLNVFYFRNMPDFENITNFIPWVYNQNKQFITNLSSDQRESDITISHHLPHDFFVAPGYQGSQLNRFFVGKVPESTLDISKLWIYGHTHTSMDRTLNRTRFICNPFGYANYELNNNWIENKIITI